MKLESDHPDGSVPEVTPVQSMEPLPGWPVRGKTPEPIAVGPTLPTKYEFDMEIRVPDVLDSTENDGGVAATKFAEKGCTLLCPDEFDAPTENTMDSTLDVDMTR